MSDQSWQTLYREALAESDLHILSRRIDAARHAFHKHLAEIEDSRDTRERQLLNNALYALPTLLARKRAS